VKTENKEEVPNQKMQTNSINVLVFHSVTFTDEILQSKCLISVLSPARMTIMHRNMMADQISHKLCKPASCLSKQTNIRISPWVEQSN